MMKNILGIFVFIVFSLSISAQTGSKDWLMLDLATDSVPGISANKAYAELLKGRKSVPVIVAVIDGGVDYKHEDLKDIMWHNPGEIPGNNKDDDNNGYIDDIYGWNFIGGKDGRNVDYDNLEVARIVKAYEYKYKNADRKKLTKKQKKEYDIYMKASKELEKSRKTAAEKAAKYKDKKDLAFKKLNLVEKQLKKAGLSFNQIDSLEVSSDTLLQQGISLVKRVRNMPDIKSIDDVRKLIEKSYKRPIEYFANQILYHYNKDYDSRKIVGDNYLDSSERYYGNADVKGPDASHGTHVSGTIAAVRNNGIGMDGIADNVKIMAIRVVPNGDERDKDVANGIRYAADNGASIINMSFGKSYSWDKKAVDKAVRYAEKKGVLMIHAAGNSAEDNDKVTHYPTDKFEKKMWFCRKGAKNWIDVGANSFTNDSMFVASFSNYGKESVDLFAPGVSIYSTTPENTYASYNGTSMATPVVAGVAAVLKSYFPGLSAKQLKKILLESSVKKHLKVYVPGTNHEKVADFSDLSVSGGEVNLYNAIKMAIEKYGSKAAK